MPNIKKRLDWSRKALAELDEAMRFYTERNPNAADRMAIEIAEAALLLIDPIPTRQP